MTSDTARRDGSHKKGFEFGPRNRTFRAATAIGGNVRIRRRTEINTETREVLVVRRAGCEAVGWCDSCGKQARFLVLGEAMALSGASSRALHRRIEASEIHFAETAEGALLICFNSLLKSN